MSTFNVTLLFNVDMSLINVAVDAKPLELPEAIVRELSKSNPDVITTIIPLKAAGDTRTYKVSTTETAATEAIAIQTLENSFVNIPSYRRIELYAELIKDPPSQEPPAAKTFQDYTVVVRFTSSFSVDALRELLVRSGHCRVVSNGTVPNEFIYYTLVNSDSEAAVITEIKNYMREKIEDVGFSIITITVHALTTAVKPIGKPPQG
jgi:hypothetical protein